MIAAAEEFLIHFEEPFGDIGQVHLVFRSEIGGAEQEDAHDVSCLGDGLNRRAAYRSGQVRVPVNS